MTSCLQYLHSFVLFCFRHCWQLFSFSVSSLLAYFLLAKYHRPPKFFFRMTCHSYFIIIVLILFTCPVFDIFSSKISKSIFLDFLWRGKAIFVLVFFTWRVEVTCPVVDIFDSKISRCISLLTHNHYRDDVARTKKLFLLLHNHYRDDGGNTKKLFLLFLHKLLFCYRLLLLINDVNTFPIYLFIYYLQRLM